MSTSKGNANWSQIRADNKQGTGELGQSATGDFIAGNVLVYDADGNAIDGGSPSGTGTVTNSGTLTADLPVFGDATVVVKVGTKTGNTNVMMSATGSFTPGNIVTTDASGNAVDGGAPSGSGTVTNTGTLTANRLIKGNGGVDITVGDLSGDVTTSGTMATTLATVNAGSGTTGDASHVAQITTNAKGLVTVQSSVAIAIASGAVSGLAAIATSGSASDLSTGTVPAARLPNPSSSTLGGIQSLAAVTSKWINTISTSGVPSATQPAESDLSITDITTNNVTTSAHGFTPKLPNDATKYLDGTGAYTVPTGSVGTGLWAGQITAPSSSGWSWDNQASATLNSASGVEYIITDGVDTSALHIRYRTAPAAPYVLTTLLIRDWDNALADLRFGLIFRQSTTGKIISYTLGKGNGAGWAQHWMAESKWTNSTTFSADYTFTSSDNYYWAHATHPIIWIRLTDDNTNLSCWYSKDGINWRQFGINQARGDFMTASGGVTGPDQIGFFAGTVTSGSRSAVSLVSWVAA